jgi:hypothetical protein
MSEELIKIKDSLKCNTDILDAYMEMHHKMVTKFEKLIVKIGTLADKLDQLIIQKTYGARQGHGFKYEDDFITSHNLKKSEIYTSKFDGYRDKLPVQIKYTKQKCEVCLGDYVRNATTSEDFILHIAFYDIPNTQANVEEYTLIIDHKIYAKLFMLDDIEKIQQEFRNISNNKTYDNKFKLFREKYKSTGLVKVRFKRDHKKQKRIQAAISYGDMKKFAALFKPFQFGGANPEKSQNPQLLNNDVNIQGDNRYIEKMKLSQTDRKKMEKFYTKQSVAISCIGGIKLALDTLNIARPIHILEPSAGAGVFINELHAFGIENTDYAYDAYDIHPEAPLIKKEDFLKISLDKILTTKPDQTAHHENLIVLGNPPYKMAVKFINKCAKLNAKLICFILPNVFKKPTSINKLDRKYHVFSQTPLQKNSFELGDASNIMNYDVPSSFFILVRKRVSRPMIPLDTPCVGYKYVSFSKLKITDKIIHGADISIIRVGGRAGKSFATDDISDDALVSKQKYNYFIKLTKEDTTPASYTKIINDINEIQWEKNNTTGPRSIGKYELNPILNKIIAKQML